MEPLPPARPPAAFVEVDVWALDSPSELTHLRAGLHRAVTGDEALPGTGLGTVPEKMVLVASELATNALKHGRPPTTVRLLRTDSEFVIDVSDHDPETTPVLAAPRAPGAGGHGLRLAKRLSLDVGWYREGDKKHIWARFRREDASVPDQPVA